MSTKVHNPNQKGHGFLYGVIAVVVIIVVLIGYVVIHNKKSSDSASDSMYGNQDNVNFSITYHDNAVTMRGDKATDTTPQVDLYEDYSCPHCAELAEATDPDMLKAIDDGKLIVNIRTLNFLDRGTDGHSTHAGAAALALAKSGNAKAYWNFSKFLLAQQNTIYGRYSDDDFANAAKQFGASDEVVDQIKAGAEHSNFMDVATSNSQKLKDETGQVSSPRVIQNGKDIDVNNWVADAEKGINYPDGQVPAASDSSEASASEATDASAPESAASETAAAN
ncbi:MAG: thioredoxin domain-containing protein [Corynebacterium sp.]|nr:thioredoxin domain-containing protein [Corynebacterium sp.]